MRFVAAPWPCRPPLGTPIDFGHPLARGLVAWIDADGDRVSGQPLSVMGAAERLADGTVYSPGGSADGAYVPFPPGLAEIGTDFTVVVFARLALLSAYSALVGVPYGSGWGAPYDALSFQRNASTGQPAFNVGYNSSTRIFVNGTSSIIATGTDMSVLAMAKTASGVLFYKDGAGASGYGFVDGSTLAVSPDFPGRQPLCIANRSATSPGEATGGVFGPVLIYSRALSEAELQLIEANPWRMFSLRRLFFVPSGGVPPMRGCGAFLATVVPLAFPEALSGLGALIAPTSLTGAAVPGMPGVGSLLAPGGGARTSAPAMSGTGRIFRSASTWAIPTDQMPSAQTIYTLTLTGGADDLDDIVIPMASFQTRLSADAIHYLSVSIPDSTQWADQIAARPNGELVVRKGVRRTDYALQQLYARLMAAAEAERDAFVASTFGGWIAQLVAVANLGTTESVLSQFLIPAYFDGADDITPNIVYLRNGSPSISTFVGWYTDYYSGATEIDWYAALTLLQDDAWLTSATRGYYTHYVQLCGQDGGIEIIPATSLAMTTAKQGLRAQFEALSNSPADWLGNSDIMSEICRVDFSGISWERGTSGDVATVTGQSEVAVIASKTITVTGIQYEALDTSGKRRLRCDVSHFLDPGDVCKWSGGQFVVGEITHRVDVNTAYMEITEA